MLLQHGNFLHLRFLALYVNNAQSSSYSDTKVILFDREYLREVHGLPVPACWPSSGLLETCNKKHFVSKPDIRQYCTPLEHAYSTHMPS